MATFTARPAFAGSKLRPAAAQPISRTRVVKALAVQGKPERAGAGHLAAAAAAALLLVSSPAMAAPSLPVAAANPVAELAGPAGKVQQAADKVGDALPGPAKGALAPDVEGQRRAGTGRAAGVTAMKRKWVAASKEDQASAAAKYPVSQVNWRRGFE